MEWTLRFFISSAFLGVGLAMDAFTVSLADGLNEPRMSTRKMLAICGSFGFFQALMPMLGWASVRRMLSAFTALIRWIPWICLGVLSVIGGSMIWEGLHPSEEDQKLARLTAWALLMQALATSLDALSVGFAIAEYPAGMALVSAGIIAGVTFFICLAGVRLGRRVGTGLSGRAVLLGGIILIAVGIEIWLEGIR